jgi:hypothetical protein
VNANKIWVGGFAHCGNVGIPGSTKQKEHDMKNLYVENLETISVYELRAMHILIAADLLTEKDIPEPSKSRKYMLIQQLANDIFISCGRKTYGEPKESPQYAV